MKRHHSTTRPRRSKDKDKRFQFREFVPGTSFGYRFVGAHFKKTEEAYTPGPGSYNLMTSVQKILRKKKKGKTKSSFGGAPRFV